MHRAVRLKPARCVEGRGEGYHLNPGGRQTKSRQAEDADTLAVIGAGAWGTTLAALQASNFRRVNLYTQEADAAEEINRFHSNSRYLDDFVIPRNVLATCSIERAVTGASTIIAAVPSHASRDAARGTLAHAQKGTRVVLATKGLEKGTGLLSLEVWREELSALGSPRRKHDDFLVLSGPNLAREVCRGMPAVSSIAGHDASEVRRAARALSHPLLTLIPYHDPVGAQVSGALKNVYAVGCGMASGLGWGDNATAAIVWRGLEETARFAAAVGGDPGVTATPAGVGDFLATCTSPLSRNHDLGRSIVGAGADEAVRGVREGAQTAGEALRRGRSLGLEMCLLNAIWSVLAGARKPAAVLEAACGTPRRAACRRGSGFGLAPSPVKSGGLLLGCGQPAADLGVAAE